MASDGFILAIDQGTTSTRAILFDRDAAPTSTAQEELPQIYPEPGWVEHDPEAIWRATLSVCHTVLDHAGLEASAIAGIGITNQRETTVVWNRATGEPVHNAIVWQDRRTRDACEELRAAGHAATVAGRTGLLLDPYFSATKIAWLLDNVEGARAKAEAGELAFGTIDSFLLWRLTGGAVHATDATNAARTMLFHIHRQDWDDELLDIFRVPRAMLPEVLDNAADFGTTDPALFGGAIRIAGMAGDQQAATVGQACFEPGMIKSTYGTGCFALINTGKQAVASDNNLLTTVAYRLGGEPTYAIEGSIFIAGAAVQWLRDGLGLIDHAAASEELAKAANPESGVYVVPAFTGLGAPYWDSEARGAIYGLTRDAGAAEIARATLEAVAYQTRDLFEAMAADGAAAPTALRVDGGLSGNDWTMQFLADMLDMAVERPEVTETTALGAAILAGIEVGLYPGPEEFAARWRCDKRFEPAMAAEERNRRYAGWRDAVRRTRSGG
ncbi:MAG: glycerol kinase GlpK [Alphaproteobacteria bacterium]|nr:glycerol kinase GlpK [Alphaproteobacteria bacterium]